MRFLSNSWTVIILASLLYRLWLVHGDWSLFIKPGFPMPWV